jgi:hypothetical protein
LYQKVLNILILEWIIDCVKKNQKVDEKNYFLDIIENSKEINQVENNNEEKGFKKVKNSIDIDIMNINEKDESIKNNIENIQNNTQTNKRKNTIENEISNKIQKIENLNYVFTGVEKKLIKKFLGKFEKINILTDNKDFQDINFCISSEVISRTLKYLWFYKFNIVLLHLDVGY